VHIKWKEAPAMGNFELAASSSGGSGSYTFLIVIVVLFALLYFVMIRPQRNKQRKVQEMQRQVQPGSRVRTTAGMYATVIDSDDQDVLLEVAPGVQIRFLRRAIMDTLPDDDGTVSSPDGGPTAADTADDAAEPASTEETAGAADASADGHVGAEHQNGAAPANGTPGSATAGRPAQDERTAD
jgi:preprotein translocase subunit YajC